MGIRFCKNVPSFYLNRNRIIGQNKKNSAHGSTSNQELSQGRPSCNSTR